MRISRKGIINDIWQIVEDSFWSQTFHLSPGMCFYLFKEKNVVVKNPQEYGASLSKDKDFFLILPIEKKELEIFEKVIHDDELNQNIRTKLCSEIDKRILESLNRIQLA